MSEDFIKWIIETHGPTGLLIFYTIWSNNKATQKRTEARDAEISEIKDKCNANEVKCNANENSLTKHIGRHERFETEMKQEMTKTREEMKSDVGKVYEEIKPIARSVSKIEGYMEAMQKREVNEK